MIKTLFLTTKSDFIGSAASSLCLVHCVVTPFLFVAHTGHFHEHHTHPFWWGTLDLVFIGVSLLAVFWSAKKTSKQWMKIALWISWITLAGIVLNEKLQVVEIAEAFIYVPSIALVILHVYNRKYCQCIDEDCCLNNTTIQS